MCAAVTKRLRSSCPESHNSSMWKIFGGDQYPSDRQNKYIYHTLVLVTLRHYSLLQLIGGRDTQVQATIQLSSFTYMWGKGSCDTGIILFIEQEEKQPFFFKVALLFLVWAGPFPPFCLSNQSKTLLLSALCCRSRTGVLSNYGALSPSDVSLLHFKLCSERWQTNDRFNFCQEEKHMARADRVSSLVLPLTEAIWPE